MPTLTPHRRPVFVEYRVDGYRHRERFPAGRIGAALARAEFVQRVEGCTVLIRHGENGRAVVACP